MTVTCSPSSDVSPDLAHTLEISDAHTLKISDLAAVLFASPLQESDHPSPQEVRATILETMQACGGSCDPCVACVAKEAGDHPETYVRRMRWSLRIVEGVYAPAP
jgi:hypothetical protein